MQGQVYRASSDSYIVNIDGKSVKCKARGILKIKSDGICVGDYVEVDGGVITKVLERKNKFVRPNVSNVDLIVAVISPEPKPDYYLIDKLYLNAVKEDVEMVIAVNKTDINPMLFDEIKKEYGGLGINVFSLCAQTGEGVDYLKGLVNGKLTVLAGQSAVGKTSIINSAFSLNLLTGSVSEKILRGKHTTTKSEIFEINGVRLIDSPGFAVIDAMVSVEELPDCYPEYLKVACECKFRGCKHVSEPDCKVKELVKNGELSAQRYGRYVEIYNEISSRRVTYEKN
ncbi:MAG: ribosome small subunit-dependent GTPase A [Clostridia bacterium]|nr:ribosome small subunit-dependent GTPase A [Clostridia bacterium]